MFQLQSFTPSSANWRGWIEFSHFNVRSAFIYRGTFITNPQAHAMLTPTQWYSLFSKDQDLPLVRGIRSFARSALGAFLVCLLVCDLLQGAAFAMNFKWSADGSMYHSVACTAQGGT